MTLGWGHRASSFKIYVSYISNLTKVAVTPIHSHWYLLFVTVISWTLSNKQMQCFIRQLTISSHEKLRMFRRYELWHGSCRQHPRDGRKCAVLKVPFRSISECPNQDTVGVHLAPIVPSAPKRQLHAHPSLHLLWPSLGLLKMLSAMLPNSPCATHASNAPWSPIWHVLCRQWHDVSTIAARITSDCSANWRSSGKQMLWCQTQTNPINFTMGQFHSHRWYHQSSLAIHLHVCLLRGNQILTLLNLTHAAVVVHQMTLQTLALVRPHTKPGTLIIYRHYTNSPNHIEKRTMPNLGKQISYFTELMKKMMKAGVTASSRSETLCGTIWASATTKVAR